MHAYIGTLGCMQVTCLASASTTCSKTVSRQTASRQAVRLTLLGNLVCDTLHSGDRDHKLEPSRQGLPSQTGDSAGKAFLNHHSWGCRHCHVLHALVQAAHLSAAVVLSMSCGLQVSDTHRLDDNKAERKRCEDAGFEVCKSTVDGKPVGPERVWPGGLAMSRTIGDYMVSHATMHSSCMYFLSPLAALLCMHRQPSCTSRVQ